MRPRPQLTGFPHPSILTPDDHHPQPDMVSINSVGTLSIPPSPSTANLDITLPHADYKMAEVFLRGPTQMSGGLWRECAILHVTTAAAEAYGQSIRDVSFKKNYTATYSKQAGFSYLSDKIFATTTGRIALQDAFITGATLRLTFRNFFGGSTFLNVVGQALLS